MSATATAEGDWKWSVEAPRFKNGKVIEYTVTEDAVNGYTSYVCGLDVINFYSTNDPDSTNISGLIECIEKGTVRVAVAGINNYSGAQFGVFRIASELLYDAKITIVAGTYSYTGDEVKPAIEAVTLADGTPVSSDDYEVTYGNNVGVGTATITVTGKGSYAGKAYATFKIAPANISTAKVTLKKNKVAYNRKARKPGVKSVVLASGLNIAKGDYTVTYKKNRKMGTATAKITGKNNCTGSVTAKFKIVPKKGKITKLKRLSKGKIRVKWRKVKGAKTYRLQWRVKGKKWKTVKTKKRSVVVSGLKKGKRYQFRVRAVAKKRIKGDWSKVRTRKVKK